MALEVFSAVLDHSDGDSGRYAISFPLFPGCVTSGRSRHEAVANGIEALRLHFARMIEKGETVPVEGYDENGEQTNVEHAAGPNPPTGSSRLHVFVNFEMEDKGERVNVYLPKHLVRAIDGFAARNGMTRSSVFGIAARRYLESEASQAKTISG